MRQPLQLNCDLGEHPAPQATTIAAAVMPYIDQANIACGVHAGDAVAIAAVLKLAKTHGVTIGAHPSYPDRENFGRRSMSLPTTELIAHLHYQIAALDGMAASLDLHLAYVKPHGALYNDMLRDADIRHTVYQTISSYHRPLPLMIQATPANQKHRSEAGFWGLSLLFEAFTDRQYDNDGLLLNRNQSGALLNAEQTIKQAQRIAQQQSVTAINGTILAMQADSLCVHGDHPDAIASIAAIRSALL